MSYARDIFISNPQTTSSPKAPEEASILCFEQIMALLERQQWQGALLWRLLPNLHRHLPQASEAIQRQWHQALRDNWPRVAAETINTADDLVFQLGVLAGAIQRWDLAATCFMQSLHSHGKHHATFYNLGIVQRQLGDHGAAQHYLQAAIAAAPGRQDYQWQLELLLDWRRICTGLLGCECLTAYRDRPRAIFATLLGPHHTQELLRQQSDPDIRRFARLPALRSAGEALSWIRTQACAPAQRILALMHPACGLIGVLGLARDGVAATFYFWIGAEYRGQGHGKTCLRLLKRLAWRLGVRHLYSSVSAANARSLSLLERGGYRCMPDVVEETAQQMGFYHLALGPYAPEDEKASFERLVRLLHNLRSRPAIRRAPGDLACS